METNKKGVLVNIFSNFGKQKSPLTGHPGERIFIDVRRFHVTGQN